MKTQQGSCRVLSLTVGWGRLHRFKMRLINVESLQLEDFSTSSTTPEYAILSHTWGDEEVTFQDMSSSLRKFSRKKGYSKIQKTCEIAKTHGIRYTWVDTCCIDKSSSAELTESINSMFQWYQSATKCYAFLEDFEPGTNAEDSLGSCRWFTRGWTLQELLAPSEVEFYDQTWTFRGTRLDFINLISSRTKIPKEVLRWEIPAKRHSVAARMSWASSRQTTRVEDIAYCLLGIFDVNMPLIYVGFLEFSDLIHRPG